MYDSVPILTWKDEIEVDLQEVVLWIDRAKRKRARRKYDELDSARLFVVGALETFRKHCREAGAAEAAR